ncbi:GNAT family N-acetyltransferase [Bacillus pseudomycoides]|uniref:GNAT family N-acetyltransferase n=1 Tax=Bacillus pseudomycoides TaxID=64104 RepID=A0A2B6JY65_9BACI|nr:GNAT family N-acetyltransferase [Bacillus pseudomycoides]PEA82641.1 GNAT family N-acetyltransferase [Bacillus pseudomycoides]PED06026.1 GNAT family N-acetyltransferase [Bacillus pseudomycoides]PEI96860.1 GNAT family N-acetyltransferase [Bacillus pseudomycoides]PEK29351.1 GNAT family N-acetyltransferase [Bacillus pseudomycoides]PEM71590.1 GNAT family N-acetyltransferase [Bacillus pseudomycoides]
MSQVTLKKITSDNWREALTLSVNIEQQKFVSEVTPPVAIALAKAYIRPDDRMIEPFGIYHNEKMVGFFNLHYELDCQKDFWLFHFFIDKGYQRKGFGATAINELINHLKIVHPSCHRIRLTVHPENDSGQKFYSNQGFTDDEILTYGELTYSLYL